MDVVVPADAERVVYDVLRVRFPDASVGATPNGSLPFVSYEIAGGSRRNRVTDAVHIIVRCYGVSRETSSDMCREAYGVLMCEPDSPGSLVRKATSVGHPIYYPDADSKGHRYQAAVQWQLRPEIL